VPSIGQSGRSHQALIVHFKFMHAIIQRELL
jgi:hypothetical protein